MIITLIEKQRGRKRVNVHLDGAFALSLAADLVIQNDLRQGQEVEQPFIEQLASEDSRRRCMDAALRLLARRPRSERELREGLRRRQFARPQADEAVARLRDMGYLDDGAFARFWVENRESASPRAKRMLRQELLARGVTASEAAEATSAVDDEDAAHRAASRRLRAFADLDFETFRRRLGGLLLRRGFSYGVAARVIARCWQEAQTPDTF